MAAFFPDFRAGTSDQRRPVLSLSGGAGEYSDHLFAVLPPDLFSGRLQARHICKEGFRGVGGRLALVASLAAAVFLCCFSGISVDYGIGGVLLPLTVHLFDFRPFGARGFLSSLYSPVTVFALFFLGQIVLAVALGGIQIFSVFSMLLIVLYSGERGKRNIKYLFYIFYPAHLLFLWGIYFLFLSLSEASIFSIF